MAWPKNVLVVIALTLVSAPQARAEGNHFIAEGSLGLMHGLSSADTTRPGHAAGALLGVGGRFSGAALRVFFIVEVVSGAYVRTHTQNFRRIELERHVFDVGAGARLVLPVFIPQLRLFADLQAVAVISGTSFVGSRLAIQDSSELDGGVRFAGGVQFRPFELLSVGLRFSATAAFDDFDSDGGRGWLIGFDSEAGHYDATAALTFYF